MSNHQSIVLEARKAIKTPFQKNGRSIGSGLDCFGLVIACAKNLNLKSKAGGYIYQYDRYDYSFKNNKDLLFDFFNKHCFKTNDLADGYFLIFKITDTQYHVAIKASFEMQDTVIHSFFPTMLVVEHSLTNFWKEKIHKIFKI